MTKYFEDKVYEISWLFGEYPLHFEIYKSTETIYICQNWKKYNQNWMIKQILIKFIHLNLSNKK